MQVVHRVDMRDTSRDRYADRPFVPAGRDERITVDSVEAKPRKRRLGGRLVNRVGVEVDLERLPRLLRYTRDFVLIEHDHIRQGPQEHVAGEDADAALEGSRPGVDRDRVLAEDHLLDLELLVHRGLAREGLPEPRVFLWAQRLAHGHATGLDLELIAHRGPDARGRVLPDNGVAVDDAAQHGIGYRGLRDAPQGVEDLGG